MRQSMGCKTVNCTVPADFGGSKPRGMWSGVRVVKLPWAEPSSRFTALFERLGMTPG